MNKNENNLKPDAKTDHINKQGMYTNMVKYDTSEKAKEIFKRPPFYMNDISREDDIDEWSNVTT